MKTIKRYPLAIEPVQRFSIPFNSEILGVTVGPALHVLEDNDGKGSERVFIIVAEGKEVEQRLNRTHYVGCFAHKAEVGMHMLHVFEER